MYREPLGEQFYVKGLSVLQHGKWYEGIIASVYGTAIFDPDTKFTEEVIPGSVCRFTGLRDKKGNRIYVGDYVRLELDDGSVRKFEVCYGTVKRKVKNHPTFEGEFSTVNITGVYFAWMGYSLFPCVDELGVADNAKMEVVGNKFADET